MAVVRPEQQEPEEAVPKGTTWHAGRGLRLGFSLGTATMRQQEQGEYSPCQWPSGGAGVGSPAGFPTPARWADCWVWSRQGPGTSWQSPQQNPWGRVRQEERFRGQGTRRAAWPVIPGRSAKSLGTTWPEAQTLKKQPGKWGLTKPISSLWVSPSWIPSQGLQDATNPVFPGKPHLPHLQFPFSLPASEEVQRSVPDLLISTIMPEPFFLILQWPSPIRWRAGKRQTNKDEGLPVEISTKAGPDWWDPGSTESACWAQPQVETPPNTTLHLNGPNPPQRPRRHFAQPRSESRF